MEERFNVSLDCLVNRSLDTLLIKRKRIAYPDPNESTLLTLPHSMSTIVSVARPAVDETPVTATLPIEAAGAEVIIANQFLSQY
jgi:hypothetical protein